MTHLLDSPHAVLAGAWLAYAASVAVGFMCGPNTAATLLGLAGAVCAGLCPVLYGLRQGQRVRSEKRSATLAHAAELTAVALHSGIGLEALRVAPCVGELAGHALPVWLSGLAQHVTWLLLVTLLAWAGSVRVGVGLGALIAMAIAALPLGMGVITDDVPHYLEELARWAPSGWAGDARALPGALHWLDPSGAIAAATCRAVEHTGWALVAVIVATWPASERRPTRLDGDASIPVVGAGRVEP